MAAFWYKDSMLKEVVSSAFTMEVKIENKKDNSYWWCIGIYASLDQRIRKEQWKGLRRRKNLWGDSWILIGDFNDIKSNEEKWRGRIREKWTFKDFNTMINENSLIDIGYKGEPWTWKNNWNFEGEVKERLDRGLSTGKWLQQFEKVSCENIQIEASDHCILLLDTLPESNGIKKRFLFDKRWSNNEDASRIIKEAWKKECTGSRMFRVTEKIKACKEALIKWNKATHVNVGRKIKEVKEQISKLREEGAVNKQRMKELKKELGDAYKEEEVYWAQKARIQWLREGDKNTAYFHACVNRRRRAN